MRALNYNFLAIVLVFLSNIVFAQDEYEKKFHESFDVSKDDTFEISNKFGNIAIENVSTNTLTIDAEIIVKSKSQDKADKIMESISIQIQKNGNIISAITELDNIKTNNASFEINYRVQMPAYLNLNLSNKYGSVNINELHGKSNLAVKYGSLNVNKIMDGNEKPLSSVELGYCERSSIKEFNWGKVIIKYSKLEIDKGKALVISSKYSQLELGEFSSVVAETGYDGYKIGTINNLIMEAKYSKIEVENLTKKFKIENKYGNIEVKNIPAGFEDIDVVSRYASVDLGIAPDAKYWLDAKSSYADVKYNDIKITERIREDHGTEIKGTVGGTDSTAKVTVRSEYGDVDLRP